MTQHRRSYSPLRTMAKLGLETMFICALAGMLIAIWLIVEIGPFLLPILVVGTVAWVVHTTRKSNDKSVVGECHCHVCKEINDSRAMVTTDPRLAEHRKFLEDLDSYRGER